MRPKPKLASHARSLFALLLCLMGGLHSCSSSSVGHDGATGGSGGSGSNEAGTDLTGTDLAGADTGGTTCTGVSADCFQCATGVYCQINLQYCQIIMSRQGTSAGCAGVPAQCLPTPTCACVSPSMCQQSAPGALTVTTLAP